MNRKVLVIGGSSFLGSSLLEQLAKETDNSIGATFTAKSFSAPQAEKFSRKGIHCYLLDLLLSNQRDADEIISKYEIIINCTGQISNPITSCFDLNTIGINKIIRSAKTFSKKLIQVSTVGVYGSGEHADELSLVKPETPYSMSKAFAEYLIFDSLPENQHCILRLSNLYGKSQGKGVISYLLKSYSGDRKLHFNNNGELLRYYMEVSDCAGTIVQTIKAGYAGTFNLTGKDKYTLKELISLFEKTLNIQFETYFEPINPYDNLLHITDDKINRQAPLQHKYLLKDFILQQTKDLNRV